jgi:Prokaryotic E2 family A/Prokaryotic homologs of the JAB domain/ThiF family
MIATVLPQAIKDALQSLTIHQAIVKVSEPEQVGEWHMVDVDVSVQLPSRAIANSVSANGVRAIETVHLEFPPSYPLRCPTPFLRTNFPTNFPHINPHKLGEPVPPCIFAGSLHELFHRFGLDGVVDQILDWLNKAAGGILMDLNQGWEPTRRVSNDVTFAFDADALAASLPRDGSITLIPTSYAEMGEARYFSFLQDSKKTSNTLFTQEHMKVKGGRPWFRGRATAMVAVSPWTNGSPTIFDTYKPDTVTTLDGLFDRADELGINGTDLRAKLNAHVYQCIISAWPWTGAFFVPILLSAKRPVPIIGTTGREVEFVTYLIRIPRGVTNPNLETTQVITAVHSHVLSPTLLAKTSGYGNKDTNQRLVLLGCGSLGSKVGMHLGRAGYGKCTFIDNESFQPHNAARHALLKSNHFDKAAMMQEAFENLSHKDTNAFSCDIVSLLAEKNQDAFDKCITTEAKLLLDTTASLQVAASAICSSHLDNHTGRFARGLLYGQGRAAVLLLEGPNRSPRCDDLIAELFALCRTNPDIRDAIAGSRSDPTQVFVGDNCRSLTMQMSDGTVSRSASIIAIQVERWLANGFPDAGWVTVGYAASEEVGMNSKGISINAPVVIAAEGDGGWSIRVSASAVASIQRDVQKWGALETGGALIGHVDFNSRNIQVSDTVDAPPDSTREKAKFVLGRDGLEQDLRKANSESIGYLHFVGTWHSHPTGGPHSNLDRATLDRLASYGGGLPMLSLVWTPTALICAVEKTLPIRV